LDVLIGVELRFQLIHYVLQCTCTQRDYLLIVLIADDDLLILDGHSTAAQVSAAEQFKYRFALR
jgi:hypothetical protein